MAKLNKELTDLVNSKAITGEQVESIRKAAAAVVTNGGSPAEAIAAVKTGIDAALKSNARASGGAPPPGKTRGEEQEAPPSEIQETAGKQDAQAELEGATLLDDVENIVTEAERSLSPERVQEVVARERGGVGPAATAPDKVSGASIAAAQAAARDEIVADLNLGARAEKSTDEVVPKKNKQRAKVEAKAAASLKKPPNKRMIEEAASLGLTPAEGETTGELLSRMRAKDADLLALRKRKQRIIAIGERLKGPKPAPLPMTEEELEAEMARYTAELEAEIAAEDAARQDDAVAANNGSKEYIPAATSNPDSAAARIDMPEGLGLALSRLIDAAQELAAMAKIADGRALSEAQLERVYDVLTKPVLIERAINNGEVYGAVDKKGGPLKASEEQASIIKTALRRVRDRAGDSLFDAARQRVVEDAEALAEAEKNAKEDPREAGAIVADDIIELVDYFESLSSPITTTEQFENFIDSVEAARILLDLTPADLASKASASALATHIEQWAASRLAADPDTTAPNTLDALQKNLLDVMTAVGKDPRFAIEMNVAANRAARVGKQQFDEDQVSASFLVELIDAFNTGRRPQWSRVDTSAARTHKNLLADTTVVNTFMYDGHPLSHYLSVDPAKLFNTMIMPDGTTRIFPQDPVVQRDEAERIMAIPDKAARDRGAEALGYVVPAMRGWDGTREQFETKYRTVWAKAKAAQARAGTGRASLADWNTVADARNLDGSRVQPLAPGRLRMMVNTFLSRLAIRPTVHVYRNQADLRQRAPDIYARAKSADPDPTRFDTARTAGYMFDGDQVIVFSDNIANEQHLQFVLAHEILGHVGLRGFMPGTDFDALMDDVYVRDRVVRDLVDARMQSQPGRTRSELTEEYLADHAGHLAVSTMARIWKAIKGLLNKLGMRFGDESARYVLDQSRRYVRYGVRASRFDAQAVGHRMIQVAAGATPGAGRYSTVGEFMTTNERLASMLFDQGKWWEGNWLQTALTTARDATTNFGATWDAFKARFLSLSNFRSLENAGMAESVRLYGMTNQKAQAVLRDANDRLERLYDANSADRDMFSQMLYHTRLAASERFRPRDWTKPLVVIDDETGQITPDAEEIRKLVDAGTLTYEQLRDGFEYTAARTGLDIDPKTGKPVVENVTRKSPAFPKLTKEQYEVYRQTRETVAHVEVQFLAARITEAYENRRVTFDGLEGLFATGKVDRESRRVIGALTNIYTAAYAAGIDFDDRGVPKFDRASQRRAEEFLVAINQAFIVREIDGAEADKRIDVLRDFLARVEGLDPAYAARLVQDFKAMLRRRRNIAPRDADPERFALQNAIKRVNMVDLPSEDAQRMARQTIGSGYAPFLRDGKFELRIEAVGADGKRVRLHPDHRALLTYSQFDTRSEAVNGANAMNEVLKTMKVEVLAMSDTSPGGWQRTEVTLRAQAGVPVDAIAADPQLNLNEFMYGLNLFGIDLHPSKREQIVRTLSKQNANARRRLLFSGNPGVDPNSLVMALSKHLEARASQIAKALTRTQLRELLNLDNPRSRRLWSGDYVGVTQAFAAVRNAANPAARNLAQWELDRQLYMYVTSNPGAAGWTGDPATLPQFEEAAASDVKEGNKYYNETARTQELMESHQTVDDALGTPVEKIRSLTSIISLAGSIANGGLNLISPYTNWMPFMASYNAKNGFGGGFALSDVVVEYERAAMQVGLVKALRLGSDLESAPYYERVARDPALMKERGLTRHEALAMAQEIRAGKLIPAQTNAMVATSAGSMFGANATTRRIVDTIMVPFNRTEQAARRSAFLAAYRMHYAKVIAATDGSAEAAEVAANAAREFAATSLDLTLGEYSLLNRPLFWRYGPLSLLYMFKVYPTTVIQLLANLSPKAQLAMLLSLWMLAGLEGLPFAEDLEDMVDTLAQKIGPMVGIQQPSVRAVVARAVEDIAPGLSPLILRGALTFAMPDYGAAGARLSLGDLVPGTGMFLAGSKPWEEFKDIAGPAGSVITGVGASLFDTLKLPFAADKPQALVDIMRESPVTMMRALGDGLAYHSSGAVVDRRGYVVHPEADAMTIASRLMGFYPFKAAEQYQLIKYQKRVVDFQREITTSFRVQWIKAKMREDEAAAEAIVAAVNRWNEGAAGTALEIRSFVRNSVIALREARRPAGERALRTTPIAGREDIGALFEAITIN
jgi:hypothetical protein